MISRNLFAIFLTIIFLVSAVTRFWPYGEIEKNKLLFDERVYVANIQNYIRGNDYFTIVPPFGKLLIYYTVITLDHKAKEKVDTLPVSYIIESDEEKSSIPLLYYRIIPMIFGTFLPVLTFLTVLLIIKFFIKKISSIHLICIALMGLFIALENSFIVESRTVSMTPILLTMIVGTILFALHFLRYKKNFFIKSILLAVLFGLSIGTKWYAVFTAPVLLIIWAYYVKKHHLKLKNILVNLFFMFLSISAIYVGLYYVQFSLLNKNLPPSPRVRQSVFQEEIMSLTLEDTVKTTYFKRFIEIHKRTFEFQRQMPSSGLQSSKWYSWPLMMKPILLSSTITNSIENQMNKEPEKIKLNVLAIIGNPMLWILSGFAIIMTPIYLIINYKKRENYYFVVLSVFVFYVLNFIPYAFIHNKLYLYTYFPAFLSSICLFFILFSEFLTYIIHESNIKYVLTAGIGVFVLFGFYLYIPFTYNLPQQYKQITTRELLSQWEISDNVLGMFLKK